MLLDGQMYALDEGVDFQPVRTKNITSTVYAFAKRHQRRAVIVRDPDHPGTVCVQLKPLNTPAQALIKSMRKVR